jgi:hypothetical protein
MLTSEKLISTPDREKNISCSIERIELIENFAVKILWLLPQFHLLCSLLQPEIKTISARISNTNTVRFQINT